MNHLGSPQRRPSAHPPTLSPRERVARSAATEPGEGPRPDPRLGRPSAPPLGPEGATGDRPGQRPGTEPAQTFSPQPTLAQLRAVVHKRHHRQIGNILARRWARPTAVYGTWLAVRLGLSAHAVTALALASGLAGAAAIGTGSRPAFIAGVALSFLAFWLDRVDGQVARWRGTASLDGVYLDYLMHHALNLALGFALGFGLTLRTGQPAWSIAGFAIAAGWTLLALHNDCRYKAFFQQLKRSDQTYRVIGGGGGRPAPPAPWPRRGLGLFTWPLYKACEAHVVLLGLAALALAALVSTPAWLTLWKAAVLLQAALAPTLAALRIARAVSRGATEAEFARWFRPGPDRPEGPPPL